MMITITLILSSLVALNFVLLIVSCNKTTKKTTQKQPTLIKTTTKKVRPERLATNHLAPTGS
ncbi:hypothetical protein [Psychroserpens sp.]|jgi:hypothetical protein|uniref:hypothetical protein n=1 Tax=Psychroserpens sp. TaxID=2020870 RepID=UPI0039E725C3